MDDFIVAAHLGLDPDPLVRREGRSGGRHDVLGDEFAVEFEVGARGADARSRTGALAFVGQELELEAAGETLVEAHALRGLSVDHHAAVEVHVLGGVGHHLARKTVFHPQDVARVGEVREEVAELLVELRVAVVRDLDHTVLDLEGVRVVLAEGMLRDLRRPTGEVLAVEKRVPLRFLLRSQGKDG